MLSLRIKISASAWVSKKPFQSPISSVAAAVEAFNMTSAGHKSSSKVLISTTDSLQTQPYLYSLERTFFMNRKKILFDFPLHQLLIWQINSYHVYHMNSPNRSDFRFYRPIIESLRRCNLAHFPWNNWLTHVILTATAGLNYILTVWFQRERFVHAAAASVTPETFEYSAVQCSTSYEYVCQVRLDVIEKVHIQRENGEDKSFLYVHL